MSIDKQLLEDIKDTLENIVASEEWETLKETSSADILIEKLGEMNDKKLELIKNLVDQLGWEYQRMGSSGRRVYKKLCLELGWNFEWNDEELG